MGPTGEYGFPANRLHDGDIITVGNIRVQARHTPGHTPEHLVFLITDGAFADEPGYVLSGDFVFVGDLGRPDLLDEAGRRGRHPNSRGALDLFDSLRTVFLALPDHVQVHPAHGAGSACGKALGAIASTTVATNGVTPGGGRILPPATETDSSQSFWTGSLMRTHTSRG